MKPILIAVSTTMFLLGCTSVKLSEDKADIPPEWVSSKMIDGSRVGVGCSTVYNDNLTDAKTVAFVKAKLDISKVTKSTLEVGRSFESIDTSGSIEGGETYIETLSENISGEVGQTSIVGSVSYTESNELLKYCVAIALISQPS